MLFYWNIKNKNFKIRDNRCTQVQLNRILGFYRESRPKYINEMIDLKFYKNTSRKLKITMIKMNIYK